jgi:hypothetical protein
VIRVVSILRTKVESFGASALGLSRRAERTGEIALPARDTLNNQIMVAAAKFYDFYGHNMMPIDI